MHEAAVAESLVQVICREAQQRRATPVRATMSCGQLNAVNDDVLTFAFEAVAKGTLCESVKLQIEHKPMQAKCTLCDRVFAVDLSAAQCPHCDSEDFGLLPDAPIVLERIEFEEGVPDGEG